MPPHRWIRTLIAFGVLLAATLPAAGQGYLSQIGYTDLQNRLGGLTPNGAGVPVAIAEAPDNNAYAPDPSVTALRSGMTYLYNGSTTAPGSFSSHATFVAQFFFGNTSMATGVTQVDSWEANFWIGAGYLGANGGPLPTLPYLPKVSNHSYISLSNLTSPEPLRRMDYLADRAQHIAVVGVGNNGSGTAPAHVWGHAYNVITVGRSDGLHNSGLTNFDGANRVKPDLVAPDTSVSGATPIVSSAATLLVQTAGSTPNAAMPQTIKAVLMAGATKSQFSAWSNTSVRPLDPVYGAGQVNINNSHRILTAGPQPASNGSTVPATGWDFNRITTSASETATRRYFMDVTVNPGDTFHSLSAVLTWHRQIDDSLNASMANLNLRLYSVDSGFTLNSSPLMESVSPVDNVQHLWTTTALPTGRYALVIDSPGIADIDYALAWQIQITPVPEPGTVFAVSVMVLVVIRRRRRTDSGCETVLL